MRITIRTRILLLFVGVAFVQTLLLGTFFLTRYYQIQRNQSEKHLQTLTSSLAIQIEAYWKNTIRAVSVASQQVERMALKPYQQYNLLSNLKKNNPAFSALALYDINGTNQVSVIGDSDDSILNIFLQEDLFTIPYNSGNIYVTQVNQKGLNRFLVISVPIQFLEHSYVIGVISAVVPCSEFQKILDPLIIPADEKVFILDSNGGVIASKGEQLDIKQFDISGEWNGERSIHSTQYFTAFSPIDFYGNQLEILTLIEKKAALKSSDTSFLLLTIPFILMLLMALFVGWKTNKYIISPLQKLARTAGTKEGELLQDGDVELQGVAHAMQDMNSHLQESNDRLKKEIILRKQDEKTAIQAQIDAEKADQAKSIFLSNISHEIKTPLHAMIVLMDMLNQESLSEKQQELLSIAIVSGQRLQTIVDSLLELSLIESGKIQLHISTFSLTALMQEIIELMQIPANDKNISLHLQLDPQIPRHLSGDSGRIRQILINLTNNGIKHTHDGRITIQISMHEESDPEKIELLFSVEDSGTGISDELRQAIFDPFERGQQDSTVIADGVGLGLAISKEFVSYMGGNIWLAKSDASGSQFCFTIQCKVASEPDLLDKHIGTQETRPKELDRIRIFLAEDDFINQRIISAYLEEYGANVEVCENGAILLKQMEDEIPDIILMDIRMPILDGIETARRIRQKEAEDGSLPVPIIALTAESSCNFEKKCTDVGMDGFLTKPIPLTELTILISELHAQRKQQQSA